MYLFYNLSFFPTSRYQKRGVTSCSATVIQISRDQFYNWLHVFFIYVSDMQNITSLRHFASICTCLILPSIISLFSIISPFYYFIIPFHNYIQLFHYISYLCHSSTPISLESEVFEATWLGFPKSWCAYYQDTAKDPLCKEILGSCISIENFPEQT